MTFTNVPLHQTSKHCLSVAELVVVSGVDARFKTKSAYMKFNCESRIRGYVKEVRLLS